MENYILSNHALTQMENRDVSIEIIKKVIENPLETYEEDGLRVYQDVIKFSEKNYLVRVYVNENKQPPVIVTLYKTSKIDKYLLR